MSGEESVQRQQPYKDRQKDLIRKLFTKGSTALKNIVDSDPCTNVKYQYHGDCRIEYGPGGCCPKVVADDLSKQEMNNVWVSENRSVASWRC